ncbi:MAG TPA: Gfo/Idh/MocA family oxidoreductase [Clostridia bacterium]
MNARWAVCGTGRMAARFLETLKSCGKNVTAVISSDLKRAREFALGRGVENYYSYENVDFDKFDIAYVATVNKRHMPDSCMFLSKGKSVLCEKPIAVNTDELKIMIETARNNDALLAEALWTAYMPAIQKAKELIDGGAIGRIKNLDSRFCIYIPKSFSRLYDAIGGGALLDVGIYNLFLAQYLLGEFGDIKAYLEYDDQGIDLTDKIYLSTPQGDAVLTSSIKKKLPSIKAVVTGEEGKIILPFFIGASKVILKTKDGNKKFSYPKKYIGYEYEIEYFENLHLNNQKQSPVFDLQKSYQLLEVMQKILSKNI